MIHPYRDDGWANQLRHVYYIRSIKSSSKPTLKHYIITFGSFEFEKAYHCDNFEKSYIIVISLDSLENLLASLHYILHGADLPIDLNSLSKSVDMRWCEEAYFESQLLETPSRFEGDRAFTISASHMYDFEVIPMWWSEVLWEAHHLW